MSRPRRLLTAVAVVVVLAAAAGGATAHRAAVPGEGALGRGATVAGTPARAGWSPTLAAAVDRYRSAVAQHRMATAELAAATEAHDAADTTYRLAARTAADAAMAADTAVRRAADRQRAAVATAVAAYVQGSTPDAALLDAFDPQAVHGMAPRRAAGEAVTIAGEDARDDARRAAARAVLALERFRLAAERARTAQVAAAARRAEAAAAARAATDERTDAAAALRDARRTEPMPGTDIPGWIFDAYADAAGWRSALDPGCALDWSLLAAIGFTESRHARFGAGADAAGTVPPILGPALDGVAWPTVILDTDGGVLDGNPAFDHAVGPMQFLPRTWRTYGEDGNGDGRADPHTVRDAVAASARYLCATRAGNRLDTPAGRDRALWAYNPSAPYREKVTALADRYAAAPSTTGWADLLMEPEDA